MNPFAWEPATAGDVQLIIGTLIGLLLLVLLIRIVRRHLILRRERLRFYAIMQRRGLAPEEQDFMEELLETRIGPHPVRLLQSLAAYDAFMQEAVQKSIRQGERTEIDRVAAHAYAIRRKLFPQSVEWTPESAGKADIGESTGG